MLKKVLAVVLSALMVLSLAACGGSSSAPAADAAPAAEAAKEEKAADTAAPAADGETLKFWGVEVASWTPAFEELLAGFEAETGIKVEILACGTGESPYTKITSAYNSGTAPTMAMLLPGVSVILKSLISGSARGE